MPDSPTPEAGAAVPERRASWISDATVDHLREVVEWPDLSGTRYTVVERLARGGMGTVFVAQDRELGRLVALKVLSAGPGGEEAKARMLREAQVLSRLEHPGVVPIHDLLQLADGRLAYSMKLVRGARLDAHVATLRGLRERLRIFERICEAVAFAHASGVIHRDLKPGNVMVGPFGEVLVMDWGVAKLLDPGASASSEGAQQPVLPAAARGTRSAGDDADTWTAADRGGGGHTLPGTVLGTPGYMSPEQRDGQADRVDRRSDVYALGVMLSELLEGAAQPPPRRLLALVRKATAHDREARYESVEQLAADVSRYLDDEPVSAYRETPFEVFGRFVQRHRGPILLLTAYLVVRILVLLLAGT